MIAYHFVGATLRDGSPIPPDGEWLEHKGPLEMCQSGLHASKHVADALRYAPGNTLCKVELDGEIIEGDDKVVAARRKILARFDATELLRADARASALSVIHLWDAPAVVREYLETGDKAKKARAYAYASASASAYASASAACAYAACAYAAAAYAAAYAAYAAASASVRESNRARLQAAVDAKFREQEKAK